MFFLLFIIICSALFIIIPICSTIEVKTKNLKIQIEEGTKKHLNDDYNITISLYFFNKIKYFKTSINSKKLQNKKINIAKVQNVIKNNNLKMEHLDILQIIKLLKIQLKNINLKVKIGTEDAALTAIITGIISTLISIIINVIAEEKKKWKVEPLYQNKNILKIEINSIFNIKMIHIIYTIYHLIMKGDKYGRTPDRRTYAYSNE